MPRTGNETLTERERLQKAIACETPDRIPIVLRLEYSAALWAGITCRDFCCYPHKASDAIEIAFDRIGGWDGVDNTWTQGIRFMRLEPQKPMIPGVDLPEDMPLEFDSKPSMTADDYDIAIKKGYYGLYSELIERRGRTFNQRVEEEIFLGFAPIYRYWEERKNVPVVRGGMTRPPIIAFTLLRSFEEISKDYFRKSDKMLEAIEATYRDSIKMGETQSRLVGSNYVFVPISRAASTFMSEKLFLKFFFPTFKEIIEQLVSDGFTPRIHADADWTPFLHYFLELPKRKCILELEPMTDMAKAKEILGGHMCLYGDVPPDVLSLGTSKDVEDYVKKKIEDVGKDGFILANDDMMPHDAKYENVKAIVDAGKKYGWS